MEKTYRRIRERFYWKGMKQEIHDVVKRCEIFQMQKLTRVKTKEPMVITDTPSEPFAKIAIDTGGLLPLPRQVINILLPCSVYYRNFVLQYQFPILKQ